VVLVAFVVFPKGLVGLLEAAAFLLHEKCGGAAGAIVPRKKFRLILVGKITPAQGWGKLPNLVGTSV
jgi:hypothetical protein